MADKENERQSEFFFENDEDGSYISDTESLNKFESGRSSCYVCNTDDDGDDQLGSSQESASHAFSSQQWPRSYRFFPTSTLIYTTLSGFSVSIFNNHWVEMRCFKFKTSLFG